MSSSTRSMRLPSRRWSAITPSRSRCLRSDVPSGPSMRACPLTCASSRSCRQRSSASCLDLWLLTCMSVRSEHLDAPGGGDPHVDGVQSRDRRCLVSGHPLWRERRRMTRAIEQSLAAVPPQLAREVRADRGDSRHPVSYTHLRAHETRHDLVCRLLLEKKKKKKNTTKQQINYK